VRFHHEHMAAYVLAATQARCVAQHALLHWQRVLLAVLSCTEVYARIIKWYSMMTN
jgi:hypothetical protein